MDDQYKSAATRRLIDLGIQSDNLMDYPTSVQNKTQFTVLQIVINLLKFFLSFYRPILKGFQGKVILRFKINPRS